MRPLMLRAYSVFAYLAFLASFTYLIGFVAGWGVPKGIDDGPTSMIVLVIAVDVGLIMFFGLAHSVMARPSFKQVWTKLIPPAAERSTYVLVASAQLALLCWQWRPIALPLWRATGYGAIAIAALQACGWIMAVLSTYLIDHFALFGLRVGSTGDPKPTLRTPLLYRWVRHPLYAGMLLAFWAAPTMTVGHFIFSLLFTVYIVIGAWHEERDLVRTFGAAYSEYQATVPMLIPRPRSRSSQLRKADPIDGL